MLVSSLILWVQGLTEAQTLTLTPLQIAQAVTDEVWGLDIPQRMKNGGRWSPSFPTTAGTFTYAYGTIASDIRKVIGIWKPSLGSASLAPDYGYRQSEDFYQSDSRSRIYEGYAFADNENRILTFKADPGNTTTDWSIDYYVSAPVLTEDSVIPVISEAWVSSLFLPGYLSYLERDKAGERGPNRIEFEARLKAYEFALRNMEDVRYYNANDGFVRRSYVEPL